MATQIFTSAGSKSISSLIGDIKEGRLILQPDFQRNLVWNDKHKESFIDTILKGFPFPEIYIAQSDVDLETFITKQVVVDGQQRLSTIKNYVENNMTCKQIFPFKDLTDQEKKDFLAYGVSVIDLGDASTETIKEVFRRINQTKYGLNSIEIQNAYYDGEFITTAKDILNKFEPESLPVFSETDTTRMVDLNYILLLMGTYEDGGYYAFNKETEDYIIRYNNEYYNKQIIFDKFCKTLEYIKNLSLPKDSMWFRKSNFFTMFCEIVRQENVSDNLKVRLISFEERVMQNKGNMFSNYGKYYSYMYTGTNSRTARIERGDLFRKGVIEEQELDS